MKRILLIILCLCFLNGCEYTRQKLATIGKEPQVTNVDDPKNHDNFRAVNWGDGIDDFNKSVGVKQAKNANSLWQPGDRYFFRDQRARRVGDILKVKVDLSDNASFNSNSEESRTATESLGVPNLFGLEKALTKKGRLDLNSLASISGNHSNKGGGKTTRTETVKTEVAAMVTQILPNGNLVIRGSQEIRVNYEIREIAIGGIVRPEDITVDNSIDSKQIAEARISYGGRGHINNMQQPRVGNQVLDAFSPF